MTEIVLGQEFDSYDEAELAIHAYSRASYSVFCKRNSRTVASANKLVKETEPRYPEHLKYSYIKYVCKHYGVPRQQGTGVRPNQRSFRIGCSVHITLSADRSKGKLVVSGCHLDHSHKTSPKLYNKYAEVRRVSCDVEETATALPGMRVPTANIARYFCEANGKALTPKHIRSIRTKNCSMDDEEESIMQVLEECINLDHTVYIVTDEQEETEVIYLQDTNMRELVGLFPEVMFLDTAYQTNKNRMKLVTIMVLDGNCSGQPVAYALLARGRKDTLLTALRAFKDTNPACLNTQVFVTNADFNEFNVLLELWPEAKIFFCQFQVLKTLRQKIQKLESGEEVKNLLRNLCQNLVSARTSEGYEVYYQMLRDKAPQEFVAYFEKDWNVCKTMWTTIERSKSCIYGKKTTNVLERYHRKVLRNLNANMSLSECLREILSWDKKIHEQVSDEKFLEKVSVRYQLGDHSAISARIKKLTKPSAATCLLSQVSQSRRKGYTVTPVDEENFKVSSGDIEYDVFFMPEMVKCTCNFYTIMNLPCQHIFAVDNLNADSLFNVQWLAQRYRNTSELPKTKLEEMKQNVKISVKRFKKNSDMKEKEKYTEMQKLMKDIVSVCAGAKHEDFCQRYEQMCWLLQAWKAGKQVKVVIDDDSVQASLARTGTGIKVEGGQNHLKENPPLPMDCQE